MRIAIGVSVCTLLACLSYAAIEIGLTSRSIASELALTAQETRKAIKDTASNTNAATADFRAYQVELLAFLRSTETKTNLALGARALRNLDRAVINLNQGIGEIRADFKQLNDNVNGPNGVLPELTKAIRQTEAINAETVSAIAEIREFAEIAQTDLHTTATSMDAALDGALRTSDSATATIEQMRVIAAGPLLVTATKSAETMTNVESITRRMAKPVSLVYRTLREFVAMILRIKMP